MKFWKWEIFIEKEWIMIHGFGCHPDVILKRKLRIRKISKMKKEKQLLEKNRETHDWETGEVPICRKCKKGIIELGFWGDDNWRKTHIGWKIPCKNKKDPKIKKEINVLFGDM